MVEIFKTNIESTKEAELVITSLRKVFPNLTINFDLEDCDKILRVESLNYIENNNIQFIVKNLGFNCSII